MIDVSSIVGDQGGNNYSSSASSLVCLELFYYIFDSNERLMFDGSLEITQQFASVLYG